MSSDTSPRIAVFLGPGGAGLAHPYQHLLSRLLQSGTGLLCTGTRRAPLDDHPNLQHRTIKIRPRSALALLYLTVVGPFILFAWLVRFRPGTVLSFHTQGALLVRLGASAVRARVVLFLDIPPWTTQRRRRRSALLRAVLYLRDCIGLLSAGTIICSSAAAANELVRALPLLEQRVKLLPHGTSYPYADRNGAVAPQAKTRWLDELPRRRQQLLRELRLPDKTLLAATLDDFQSLQSIEYVLRAFESLEDERFYILIYGDGPQRLSVLALLISLGLTEKVQLLQRSEAFFEMLPLVDLIVIPESSRGSVTFSEPLGSGAAVLAVDVPQNREILQYSELLLEQGNVQALVNALRRIRAGKDELRKLKNLTQLRANSFSYDWVERAIKLMSGAHRP